MPGAHDHLDSGSQVVLAELIASDTVDGCLMGPVEDLGPERRQTAIGICGMQLREADLKRPERITTTDRELSLSTA
jgi:hypothetical protein